MRGRLLKISRSLRLTAVMAATLLPLGLVCAAIAIDEESPWPRVRSTNGYTVTLHLPQVESWTSNSFRARATVEVKQNKAVDESLGVIWFEGRGRVDHSNRLVLLDSLEITKSRFPDTPDNGANALSILGQVLPSGARTVSLDYLIAALGFEQAAARQGAAGLKHSPPEIIWVTNRTVLVIVDGDPVLRPVTGTVLERVVNTPEIMVRDKSTSRFFLAGDDKWFVSDSILGSWSLMQTPPADVLALAPAPGIAAASHSEGAPPRVIVRTNHAELLTTSGLPDFRPIRGTDLQYAADTDSQLLFHTKERTAYILLSGRWFKAAGLNGPWTYVAPGDLPSDFSRIPPGSPQAIVLASVPDTSEAQLALIANSVPSTATIKRKEATIRLTYDGEPQFQPIEGTELSYAVNAQLPVILSKSSYYALDNGVWFCATSSTGPWQVAAEVPEEIYSIPPSSPVYYATFVRVYQANPEEVEVGYTPGYQGSYENDGTVVYGTGWNYQPWNGNEYYGWGWTYGYDYVYVPWYQWWAWRPWWNNPGGLRAAVIENVYDRWAARNGVVHYDRPAGAEVVASASWPGHPAVYGRYWPTVPSVSYTTTGHPQRTPGAGRQWPQTLPANTIAFNPYSRPQAAMAPGEIPRGAQLLSTVRQAPGGGRDLYASPDGGVYQRKADGWYRRESGGGWKLYAPLQAAAVRSSQAAGWVYRPVPAGRSAGGSQALANRVPNSGYEARAQQVAALERQYYARSLAQARAQSWRAPVRASRPVRSAGPARPAGRRR